MPNVLILTDGSAKFTCSAYPGDERVHVLPWWVRWGDQPSFNTQQMNLAALPVTLRNDPDLMITPPSADDFFQALTILGQQAHEIVVILASAHLSPIMQYAQQALQTVHCPALVHVVDSQNIGAGLGMLVQAAAQMVAQGESGATVCRYVRGLVPHTYSLFCVQSLTYLSRAGHLDPAQALVGEMLNVTPFFMLENGILTPVQKARSSRQLMEVINEFIMEFDCLENIALLYGSAPFDQEAHILYERLGSLGQAKQVSEHVLNPAVAAIFGPRCLGISVMEENSATA